MADTSLIRLYFKKIRFSLKAYNLLAETHVYRSQNDSKLLTYNTCGINFCVVCARATNSLYSASPFEINFVTAVFQWFQVWIKSECYVNHLCYETASLNRNYYCYYSKCIFSTCLLHSYIGLCELVDIFRHLQVLA